MNNLKTNQKVTIFGAFDIVHPGHIHFLKQAIALGDVTLVLARDKTINKIKGHQPFFNEKQRIKNLQKLKIINKIILGDLYNPYKMLTKTKPEIILLGNDQKIFINNLEEEIKKRKLKTIIKRATAKQINIFKSSKIKPVIENFQSSGFLNINKPTNMTSHDVIAILRKTLNIKQIGHAGTLDPLADGVLICGINKATKLLDWWHTFPKTYKTTIELGKISDTYDNQGKIKTITIKKYPTKSMIIKQLNLMTGKIQQTPPLYSAKKINGKKAYELARKGKKIKLKKRQIIIYKIKLLSYKYPKVKLEITCSSGTYIRSIAHDLGKKLKTGAIMTQLTRTVLGPINLKKTIELKKITNLNWQNRLYPAEKLLKNINKLFL